MASHLELLVQEHIRRGEHLLALARIVGRGAEHEVWRAQRVRWVDAAAKALERADVAGPRVRAFERTAAIAPGDGPIFEVLPLELERIREGIESLRTIGGVPAK